MSYDPHDPRGQEVARRKARDQDRLRVESEVRDIHAVMSTEAGRRVVHDLYLRAGLLFAQSAFNTNSMTMAHTQGARDLLARFDWLVRTHCSREFHLMLDEHKEIES